MAIDRDLEQTCLHPLHFSLNLSMSHQNFGVSGFCFHFLRRVDLGYGPIRARNTARWATVAARSAGSKELLETLNGSKELMRVWPKEWTETPKKASTCCQNQRLF